MITLDEYLDHWKVNYGYVRVPDDELSEEIRREAQVTVDRANALLGEFGEERPVNSGWRPLAVNRAIPGAALRSNHTRGMAIDLGDPDGDLDDWCMDHFDVLRELRLWLEHPAATKGWCHVQTVAPKSWKRCFYP